MYRHAGINRTASALFRQAFHTGGMQPRDRPQPGARAACAKGCVTAAR